VDETIINAEMIRDDLFVLGPDSAEWPHSANVYVIIDDRGFSLIDLGCGGDGCVERIVRGLSQLGLSLKRLHTVVLSHAHPDHMGASERLFRECAPTVMIHGDDINQARDPRRLIHTFDIELARRLYSDEKSHVGDFTSFFDRSGCPMSLPVFPDRILADGELIELGGYRFEVVHTPGHSPGHISLFDGETGILYGGDLVGEVVAWYTPSSGGVIGYLSSLDRMQERQPRVILPAHGGIIHEPLQKIEEVRERLLARERKMIDILAGGGVDFFELVDRMISNERLRFFPGVGITESHVQKLIADGRATRSRKRIELL
jgi:glyoxylase-like metal-dependent hydrolase (beta-lactamase superfamily II)